MHACAHAHGRRGGPRQPDHGQSGLPATPRSRPTLPTTPGRHGRLAAAHRSCWACEASGAGGAERHGCPGRRRAAGVGRGRRGLAAGDHGRSSRTCRRSQSRVMAPGQRSDGRRSRPQHWPSGAAGAASHERDGRGAHQLAPAGGVHEQTLRRRRRSDARQAPVRATGASRLAAGRRRAPPRSPARRAASQAGGGERSGGRPGGLGVSLAFAPCRRELAVRDADATRVFLRAHARRGAGRVAWPPRAAALGPAHRRGAHPQPHPRKINLAPSRAHLRRT